MAKEISEIAAYPNRLSLSAIRNPQSAIERWLRSFPTTRLKRRQSDNDSRRMSMLDRFWLSKANSEVARLNLSKVSSLDWEAAPPSQARRLRFCTNIRT